MYHSKYINWQISTWLRIVLFHLSMMLILKIADLCFPFIGVFEFSQIFNWRLPGSSLVWAFMYALMAHCLWWFRSIYGKKQCALFRCATVSSVTQMTTLLANILIAANWSSITQVARNLQLIDQWFSYKLTIWFNDCMALVNFNCMALHIELAFVQSSRLFSAVGRRLSSHVWWIVACTFVLCSFYGTIPCL